MLQPGITGQAAVRTTTENTAAAMGSGQAQVLATPAVAALVEKACWQCVAGELDPACSTVGTRLDLRHSAPTPVGMVARCRCELTAVEGRRLTFAATVWDDKGEVARAVHERCIVESERFQQKADAKNL